MMQQRSFTDFFVLGLLGIPALVLGLILVTVYVIADSEPSSSTAAVSVESAPAPLSESAALIATVNAAPARQLPPVDIAAASAETGYDPALVSTGERNFLAVCTACHGTDARGISGLGKTLVNSEFVRANNDDQLLEFIIVGRDIWDPANTTGVQMPARGGNPGLTDNDIRSIIAYVRILDGFVPDGSTTTVAVDTTAGTETTENSEPVTFEPIELGSIGGSDENAESVSVEFTQVDVSAFLASLGVVLPEPLPQPDRTGSQIHYDVCGIRYIAEGITPEPDICMYLADAIAKDTSGNDLFGLLVTGTALGDTENPYGFDVLPRVAYPPLNNEEIQNWLEYLYFEQGKELILDANIFGVYPDLPLPATSFAEDASFEPIELESSAPESQAETSTESSGEAIYVRACGVGTLTACDYIKQELENGTPVEDIIGVLKNGLSSFAANNPLGVNITPGITYPELTDAELQSLIDYVSTLE